MSLVTAAGDCDGAAEVCRSCGKPEIEPVRRHIQPFARKAGGPKEHGTRGMLQNGDVGTPLGQQHKLTRKGGPPDQDEKNNREKVFHSSRRLNR
jgi:hypothetical protein